MDNGLPPQAIDSLPAAQQQDAYRQVGLFSAALGKGIDSEEELATQVGFYSAETVKISLSNWGLSSLPPAAFRENPRDKKPSVRHARQGVSQCSYRPQRMPPTYSRTQCTSSSPRTPTLPLTEPVIWRKLLAAARGEEDGAS